MKLRLQITKDKEIRFISHLEYMRTLSRAIRRAKLPVAYSEGFNPHMKFSLASALGVGVASYSEFMEVELAAPVDPLDAANALSRALPTGIRIKGVDCVETNAPALMSVAGGAEYRVTLPYSLKELKQPEGEAPAAATEPQLETKLAAAIEAFNSTEHIIYAKAAPKTRAKVKEIDVKFYIPRVEAKLAQGLLELHFYCKITPTGSMKAVDLLNTLNQQYCLGLPVHLADIERLDLYRVDEKGNMWPMLDSLYQKEEGK